MHLFILALWCIFTNIEIASSQLSAKGANVCSKMKSYTTYFLQSRSRSNPVNYRTCCKRFIGICTSRCTRVRYEKKYYSVQVSKMRFRRVYFCCTGWARSGNGCPNAICNPGCRNGGTCFSPGKCKCRSGFQGNRCQFDKKECSYRPRVCDQKCHELTGSYACACNRGYVKTVKSKPTDRRCSDVNECRTNPCTCAQRNDRNCVARCINTVGSFSCSCKRGYQLLNRRVCNDINECTTRRHNCAQTCSNTAGSFICSCRVGYRLLPDRRSCQNINECARINGGCSQICQDTVGSYKCKCRSGYGLSNNRRTCFDINECRQQRCDQKNGICRNVPGSYRCSCKTGYQLKSDRRSCIDINECARNTTNNCQQNCHNTIGSYTCSCNSGYRLQTDKHNCADINECVEQNKCEYRCLNIIGSYICSCRSGYRLNPDRKTCKALPCVDISAPVNGNLSCNGYVTDKICRVTCDEGFNLSLETSQNPLSVYTRQCTADSTWSGDEPSCKAKQCPEFLGPENGAVIEPCVEFFGSKCLTKCSKGFYLDGENTNECLVEDGKTYWSPNNATCKAATPCQPNPCENGGRCIRLSHNAFECDCTNTFYTGTKCEVGIIQLEPIPDLIVGKDLTLRIYARPRYFVKMTVISDPPGISTDPSPVTIYEGSEEVTFKLDAVTKGKYTLKFEIDSKGQSFQKIPDEIIFVRAKAIKINPVKVNMDFFDSKCIERPLVSCPNGKTVAVSSSCNQTERQDGFLTVHSSDDFKIPLVITGLSIKNVIGRRLVTPTVNQILENRTITNPCSNCSNSHMNTDALNYIIRYGYFEKYTLREFSSQFMFGVSIDTNEPFSSEEMNYRTIFGRGDELSTEKSLKCRNVNFQTSKWYSIYNPRIPITMQLLSIMKEIPKSDICFVYNHCDEEIQISLAKESSVDLQPYFESLGLKNYKLKSSGFKMFKGKQLFCFQFDQFSSKDHCVRNNLNIQLLGNMSIDPETTISIDGSFAIQLNHKAMLSKLDEEILLAYKGKLSYTVEISQFGNTLRIEGFDDDGEIYGALGGTDKKCPSCQLKGIMIAFKASKNTFRSEQNLITLIPQEGTFIIVQMPYNAQGGTVIGLAHVSLLDRRISILISHHQSKFTNFTNTIKLNYREDYIIISKLIKKYFAVYISVKKILQKRNHTYEEVFTAMNSVKPISYDLLSVLKAFLLRTTTSNFIVQSLINLIKTYLRLSPEPLVKKIRARSEGKIITYKGDICISRFCLHDVTTKISDIYPCDGSCFGDLDEEYSLVQVTTEKQIKLSSNMYLKKNGKMALKISKYSKQFEGSLEAEINILDQNLPIKINFINNEVAYDIRNLKLGNGKLSFRASGKIKQILTSWEDITSNINGKSTDHTAILEQMQTYFEGTAKDINKRQREISHHTQIAASKYREQLQKTSQLKTNYIKSKEAFEIADAMYKITFTNFTNNKLLLKSYLDNQPLLKAQIEQNVNSICEIKQCQAVCISTQSCDVCQNEVETEVDSLECVMVEQIKRETNLVPFDTTCNVMKREFKNIYTGTCALSPQEQRKQDGLRKGSLIATGSAVGALIGGPIGGLIGGFVGFVGSLFSSCDRSYKAIEEKTNVQESCTKLRTVTISKKVAVSKCMPVKNSVPSGFSIPNRCNCQVKSCGARVSNESCVQRNGECRKNREKRLGSIKEVHPDFVVLSNSVKELESLSNVQYLEVEKARITKDISFKKYSNAKNLINILKQESNFANGSLESLRLRFKKEICLSNVFDKTANISEILHVENVQFDLSLPVNDKIELQVNLKEVSSGQKHTISVLYSLTDAELTSKGGAKKILNRILCPFVSNRRRREVITNKTKDGSEEDDDDDLPFVNWFKDSDFNTTSLQKACVSSRTAFTLLHKIANVTVKHAREAVNTESSDIPIRIYEDLSLSISETHKEILNLDEHEISKDLNIKSVIAEIKRELEVFISLQNYSVCFDFDDCREAALKTLRNLPSLLTSNRKTYNRIVDQVNAKIRKIYSPSKQSKIDFQLLSTLALQLQRHMKVLKGLSLHCTDGPSITRQPLPKYDVIEGRSFYMTCQFKSQLPINVYWTKNNKIIDGAVGTRLTIIKVNEDSSGVYKCHVFSLAGNASSDGSVINVVGPPKLYPSIKKLDHYMFKQKVTKPQLICNVTGKPEPTIQWFYREVYESLYRVIKEEKSAVLNVLKVGFYYCRAYNKYGRVQTDPIRVNILGVRVPDMALTVSLKIDPAEIINKTLLLKHLQQPSDQHIKVTFANHTATLSVYSSRNKTFDNETTMLIAVTKQRQEIANTAALFLNNILNGNASQMLTHKDGVKYDSKFDICAPGYKMNENGFMCVECPIGTYGAKCTPCPRGTYQPMPGQMSCVKKPTNHTVLR